MDEFGVSIESAMRSWALMLLLILVGCATTAENIDEPSELATVLEQKDRSVVFGRVRWIENGEEKEIGDSYFEMQLRPGLVRMEETARLRKECGLKNEQVSPAMMRHDERLPKSIETTNAFRIATVIITAMGIYGVGSY